MSENKRPSKDTSGTDGTDDLQSVDAAELFRACFDNSASLMGISSLENGRHIDVNRAWIKALGHSRDEAIAKTALELNLWAFPEERAEIIDKMEKDGFVSDFEATLRAKNGDLRFCVISVSRFASADETYLLFSANDLTKRKKLESELRTTEERYSVAAEQAGLAYWRWSFAEQKLTDWSGNYKTINAYGDTPPDTYDAMLKPVHPDDKERVVAAYAKADSEPSNFDVEFRIYNVDGDIRWLHEHGELEYDVDGNAVAHIGILQDITSLKKAQHALERLVTERTEELGSEIEKHRETKGYADAMIENTAEGMVTIGDKGIIESFNPAAEGIFGYTADEVVGKNVSMLIPAEDRDQHDEYVEKSNLHASRIINKARDLYGLRKNGEHFPLELNVSRMPLEGQTKFIGILHDITDRKNSEKGIMHAREQAELASRAKSELLANMSHELRTPLNAIIGFSQMFMSQVYGSLGHDKYLEYAADINTSSIHLLELINDILDVSAIEAGKLDLHDDEIDLSKTVEAMRRLISPRAEKQGVSIAVDVPDQALHLRGDDRRIKQTLLNLLSNAIKFTKSGGEVRIKTGLAENGGVTISVSDTGIGMSKTDLAYAIDKFGQVDSGLNRKNEGTGLGLPLTISLVELHDGTLDIESAPGKGTTVTIRLPKARVINRVI